MQKQYSVTAKTPKDSSFWEPIKWLSDNEIPWLVEKYVNHYGMQFENFGELSVVNMPRIENSSESMILFHHPLALNSAQSSIASDHQPQHMLQQLWRSCVLVNNTEPHMPSRFKVCFQTNLVQNTLSHDVSGIIHTLFGSKERSAENKNSNGVVHRDNSRFVTGNHWFNIVYEFTGLRKGVLEILNNIARGEGTEITFPPPVDNEEGLDQQQVFFDKLPFYDLYEHLRITIMDSASHHTKAAHWFAKRIRGGFTNVVIQQMPVYLQNDFSTCADHSARNGVHFSLFGTVPTANYNIRKNYLDWRQQEENANASLALLKGFYYRLTYLQPGDEAVIAMAQTEMHRVIDAYSAHITEQVRDNSVLNPFRLLRLHQINALAAIKTTLDKQVPLVHHLNIIETEYPKMFDASWSKLGFMSELVDIVKKLQHLCLPPVIESDSEDALHYYELARITEIVDLSIMDSPVVEW